MRLLNTLSPLLIALFATQAQAADVFNGLGGTPARAYGISADGSVVVGENTVGINLVAYRWSNGIYTSLGTLTGGTTSTATATSADGSVVVGQSNTPGFGFTQAFRWQNGVMTGLGYLPGNSFSSARGVSSNGSVIVGFSAVPLGVTQAFRWQGGVMTGLGFLPGDVRSWAYGVSGDGSTVVGLSNSPISSQAFRWTQATGMTGLGFLPGGLFSAAYGISTDGSTIVGESNNGISTEAFSWKGGIMTGLGFLPGDTVSRANASNYDGSVIVGSSSVALFGSSQAFRWTKAGGMASVVNWLLAAGVTVPAGWTLSNATGVSLNGNVVVGDGLAPGGASQPWLARVGRASGLLTDIPAYNLSLTRTFADLPNLTLFGAHHRTLLDNGMARTQANGTCMWAVGDVANHKLDKTALKFGEIGVCQDIGNTRLGVGVGLQSIRQTLSVGGNSRYDGQAFVIEAAHAFENGVQPSITGYAGSFNTQLSRNYMNGANMDNSTATPKANAFAVRLRLDIKNLANINGLSLSPYFSYTKEKTKLDAYSEVGGGFPAQFSASSWRVDNFRLGNAASIALSDSTDLRIGMELVHNISNTGSGVTGNVIGLWNFAQPGQRINQNGVRLMIDADHRFTPTTALSIGVNAGSGNDSTWGATTGIKSFL